MSASRSTDFRSSARARAVSRLLGTFRGWLEEEIHAIRVAQMDDAFFATAKGVQYRPTPGLRDGRASAP